MLRTIERPTYATLRPCATAASITCWTRCTWEAKQATMIRWSRDWWNTRSSTGPISTSDVVNPGTSELVESTMNRSTPSTPSLANARRSVIRPSSGSWSILKSPVCSTVPAPVRIATASASGIEWLTATNSSRNGPNSIVSPSLTTCCTVSLSRCSRSLEVSSARVSCEPTSGMSPRSRRRYGVAPMWSSWPCVSTRASTWSSRSRIGSKSGRMRSTPGWWSSGNSTPQSTTSSRPSYSKTVMLRPTSPRPPRGMTRRPLAGSGPGADSSGCGRLMQTLLGEDSGGLQHGAEVGHEGLVCGHEREPDVAVGKHTQELERGLGRHRPLGSGHDGGDDRDELAVGRQGGRQVAAVHRVDHRAVVVTGDVPDDGDDPAPAVGQPAEVQHVVAGVERQPGVGHDPHATEQVPDGVLDRDDVGVRRD